MADCDIYGISLQMTQSNLLEGEIPFTSPALIITAIVVYSNINSINSTI